MADYAVLYGKYQRALCSIRELEQEKEFYEQQIEEMKHSHMMIEKNTKTLCETILKKERERKDEKTWFKMPLIELIAAAQTSLENYFPSLEKEWRGYMDKYNARSKKIVELEEKIETMEEQHKEELKELKKKAATVAPISNKQTQEELEQEIEEAEPSTVSGGYVDLNNIVPEKTTLIVDENDHMEDVVANSVAIMYSTGSVKEIAGPKVFNDKKAQKNIDTKVSDTAKELSDNISKETLKKTEKLNDNQKLILQAFGNTGYSEFKEICSAAATAIPNFPNESTARRALYILINSGFIEASKVSLPGSANLSLYKLTESGKFAYKFLYNKEAKESEIDTIIKNHTSIEHGYGIKQSAKAIEEMKFIKNSGAKVYYMTRAKDFIVQTSPNTRYIPDIVIVTMENGKENIMYIEYETGKCNDIDFFKKCNKISSFRNAIYFIVPDQDAKDITEERIKKWKEYLKRNEEKFQDMKKIRIYMSTFKSIKNGDNSKEIKWEKKYVITPPGNKETASVNE